MARIPCHVRKFIGDRFFCFVPFSVRFSHCFGFIEALVDTGSPYTVLSTTDALRLKLPITTMRTGNSVYVAGFCFFNHPLDKARLNFKTENARYLSIDMKLGVLIPTKIDEKTINDVKHVPSLIGNDFLEEQKFTLSFDPSAKLAYLEHEQ